jgi:hypothetical protein
VIVIVNVEVWLRRIRFGEKAFEIVGGATTVNVAVAVRPAPPSVEETVPVVLFFVPAVVPVTATVKVQVLPGVAIAPLANETVVAPAVAVNVPPQVFVAAGVTATCSPAGKASETAMFVRPTVFPAGFVIISVSVDVPFNGICVGENTFVIVGGATTVRLAVAVRPGPLSVAVTLPVVLVFRPGVVPVMATLTVQLELEAIVPALREIVVALPAAVKVPPHVLEGVGDATTCVPAGRLSVTARPVSGMVLGFVNVRVSVEDPPIGI